MFRTAGKVRVSGGGVVQTARPRDVGALVFVVGLFLVLFVISAVLPGLS
jgi:hypothetical protein